ncbi:hypothetical protein BDK63_001333 [Halomonas campaniensis]|uniref:Uncharacterized protein n=1 Tax=Halomonas campaniensis TaxID=213554 RepID=A0A7W5K328_9GAMM|nr:hypothetical protein [Halomonas campaniensis]MBB3330467.1 hypothetical protein [Halomonas campaniensis]
MTARHSPALRRLLVAGLLPLALAVGSAQGAGFSASPPLPDPGLLLASSDHADGHDSHGGSDRGQRGGQGQGKRLGKGAGTGEARGGHSVTDDIFRDEGFSRGNPDRGGGPPEGRGEHEDGDDHDHEEGDDHDSGPPEGRGGGHESGEEHDHES